MRRMRRRAPYRRVVADNATGMESRTPRSQAAVSEWSARCTRNGGVPVRDSMGTSPVGNRWRVRSGAGSPRPTKGGSDATHLRARRNRGRRPPTIPTSAVGIRSRSGGPKPPSQSPAPPNPTVRPSPAPPPAVRASELRGRPPQGMAARGRETGGSGPPDESFGGSRAPGRHRPHTTPVQAGERRVGPDTARRHHTVTNGGSHEAPLPRPLADHPIFNRSARFDRNRKTVPADGSSRKVPPACATGPSCRRPRSAGFAATAVRVRSDGGIVPPRPARKRSPRGAPRRRRGVGPDHTLPAARSPPPGGTGRLRRKPHTTIRRRRGRRPSRAGRRRHVNWSGRTRCLLATPDAFAPVSGTPATVRAVRSSGRRPTHIGRVSTLPETSVGPAIVKFTSRLRRNREFQIKGSDGRWAPAPRTVRRHETHVPFTSYAGISNHGIK